MSVSNLATDDIFITYQLKPINAKRLTYSMNVLDWPSGDTDGQIMRVSETTFADTSLPTSSLATRRRIKATCG